MLTVLVLAVCCSTARAQVDTNVVTALLESLSSGDADALAALAGDRMEIGVFGAAELYSVPQARRVMGRFFEDHPPARVSMGETSATDTGWYATVRYGTEHGETLRMYVRLRFAGDRWLLREIVIPEGRS